MAIIVNPTQIIEIDNTIKQEIINNLKNNSEFLTSTATVTNLNTAITTGIYNYSDGSNYPDELSSGFLIVGRNKETDNIVQVVFSQNDTNDKYYQRCGSLSDSAWSWGEWVAVTSGTTTTSDSSCYVTITTTRYDNDDTTYGDVQYTITGTWTSGETFTLTTGKEEIKSDLGVRIWLFFNDYETVDYYLQWSNDSTGEYSTYTEPEGYWLIHCIEMTDPTNNTTATIEVDTTYLTTTDVDAELSTTSENPVQNKVITAALEDKVDKTQYASTTQAGIIKLYSSGSSNRSGIVVTDEGVAYVSTDSSKGTTRNGAGQVTTASASQDEITAQENSYKPIVPSTLSYAVQTIGGQLADLETTDQSSYVAAINELKNSQTTGGVTVDTALSTTSSNPVANSAITAAINDAKVTVIYTVSNTSSNPVASSAIAAELDEINTKINELKYSIGDSGCYITITTARYDNDDTTYGDVQYTINGKWTSGETFTLTTDKEEMQSDLGVRIWLFFNDYETLDYDLQWSSDDGTYTTYTEPDGYWLIHCIEMTDPTNSTTETIEADTTYLTTTDVDATLSETSENPVQNKIINSAINTINTTIANADNWNDCYEYCDGFFNNFNTSSGYQNINEITDDIGTMIDLTTTATNLVGAINELKSAQTTGGVTVDTSITSSSSNPVTSSAIYTALSDKISSSEKGTAAGVAPLNSSTKIDNTYLNLDTALSTTSTNPVQNKVINSAITTINTSIANADNWNTCYDWCDTFFNGFDTSSGYLSTSEILSDVGNIADLETTATNLVDAVNEIRSSQSTGGVTVDTTITESSTNPVTSAAIYTALEGKVDTTQYASVSQAGLIKLYGSGSTNKSGLAVTESTGAVYVATDSSKGTTRNGAGQVTTAAATTAEIDAQENSYKPIVPSTLSYAVQSIGGSLTDLETTDQSSYIAAINELKNSQTTGGVTVDTALSDTSTNPVTNKAITAAIDDVSLSVSDALSLLGSETLTTTSGTVTGAINEIKSAQTAGGVTYVICDTAQSTAAKEGTSTYSDFTLTNEMHFTIRFTYGLAENTNATLNLNSGTAYPITVDGTNYYTGSVPEGGILEVVYYNNSFIVVNPTSSVLGDSAEADKNKTVVTVTSQSALNTAIANSANSGCIISFSGTSSSKVYTLYLDKINSNITEITIQGSASSRINNYLQLGMDSTSAAPTYSPNLKLTFERTTVNIANPYIYKSMIPNLTFDNCLICAYFSASAGSGFTSYTMSNFNSTIMSATNLTLNNSTVMCKIGETSSTSGSMSKTYSVFVIENVQATDSYLNMIGRPYNSAGDMNLFYASGESGITSCTIQQYDSSSSYTSSTYPNAGYSCIARGGSFSVTNCTITETCNSIPDNYRLFCEGYTSDEVAAGTVFEGNTISKYTNLYIPCETISGNTFNNGTATTAYAMTLKAASGSTVENNTFSYINLTLSGIEASAKVTYYSNTVSGTFTEGDNISKIVKSKIERIGTWMDGTPIWRSMFKYVLEDVDKDDFVNEESISLITYCDTVSDDTESTAFIIGGWAILSAAESPCIKNDLDLVPISGYYCLIDTSAVTSTWMSGTASSPCLCGYVDFVAAESDLA